MPRRAATTEPAGPAASDDLDLSRVAVLVDEGDPHGNLIALLQRAQESYGYLPEPVVDEIARLQRRARLAHLRHHHVLRAVHAPCPAAATRSACATAPPATWPAPRASPRPSSRSSASPTARPPPTWSSRLDSVACMGACSQAPVMRIDEETYGNLTADQTRKIVRDLIEEVGRREQGGGDGDA